MTLPRRLKTRRILFASAALVAIVAGWWYWTWIPGSPLRTEYQGLGGQIITLTFPPDGHLLAVGSDDGAVILWDIATGEVRLRLEHDGRDARPVSFSPDARLLAVGSRQGGVKIWDVASGQALETVKPPGNLRFIQFSPDSQSLTVGTSEVGADQLTTWDVTSWRERPGREKGTLLKCAVQRCWSSVGAIPTWQVGRSSQ